MIVALVALLLSSQAAAPAASAPQAAAGETRTASDIATPPVDIVLFSDFQCPFCANFAKAFRDLQTKGVDGVDIRVSFRNFPLSIHPRAQLAHQAAMAAREQGKFWEMHDLLFANQHRAERDDLIAYAKQLGLDVPRFLRDLDSPRLRTEIAADMAEGEVRRIGGTPTFYVNGREYVGTKSTAELRQLIEGEQRRVRAVAEIGDEMVSRGPARAPVTVEFYADLQSPVTRPASALLDDVMKRYPSQVRLVFRNFPLAFHPQAALAHEAAMTAAREGRFWDFAAYVLEHQDALREQELIALAGRLGLDAEAFASKIAEHRYAARVEADVTAGFSKGIHGSPVLLVNGRRIDGVPSLQTLVEYIETALAATQGNAAR